MSLPKIHKFELDGDCFIIDPASGAVHIADQTAFNELDSFSPYTKPVNSAQRELLALYEQGLLFSAEDCREYAQTHVDAPLKAFCLHVSHDCNLRCGYCFAKELLPNEAIHLPQREHDTAAKELLPNETIREHTYMTPEVGIAALEMLVANSGEREFLEADFFGGEPTLPGAWETVVAVVKYARANEARWGKKFDFTVTTNGLLLDDSKIDFINAEMSNCVLSLDGRKAVNDRMRPTLGDTGTFDTVVPKFTELLKSRIKEGRTDCFVRGTFTAHNLDFAEDVLELARLGFKNISLEPVSSCPTECDSHTPDRDENLHSAQPDYAIRPEHVPQVCAEYERLFRLMKSRELDVNFFHFNIDLTGGPCVIRRLRGCGAGNEYLAVAPDGAMFPCHRFVGDERWRITAQVKDYFSKTHIYSKSDCPDCWARFYCSGGCNAASYECFGDCRKTDSNSVDCLLMKKRLECAIALSALRSV